MNHQYAFAIAFDQRRAEDDSQSELQLSEWEQLIGQLSEALASQGFPELNHPRWEEFGDGHIFWGTKAECDSLKTVLSSLPVSLYEERNLEPGYYTDPEGTYYVNPNGDIFGMTHQMDFDSTGAVEPLWTIPLNAYKTRTIAAELDAAFQQAIASPSKPLNHLTYKPVDILEQQFETQSDQIEALEAQVTPEGDIDLLDGLATSDEVSSEQAPDAFLAELDAMETDFDLDLEDKEPEAIASPVDAAPIDPPQSEALVEAQPELNLDLEEVTSAESLEDPSEMPLESVEALMTDLNSEVESDELEAIAPSSEDVCVEELSISEDIERLEIDAASDPSAELLTTEVSSGVEVDNSPEAIASPVETAIPEATAESYPETEEAIEEQTTITSEDYNQLNQRFMEQSQTILALEQQAQQLQLELEEANRSVTAQIDPAIFHNLQQEKEEQSSVIQSLEQQIAVLNDDLQQAKADPQDSEAVNVELTELTQEVELLKQAKQQLTDEVEQWTQVASSKIELEVYDSLSQAHQDQSAQLKSFEQEINDLKQELSQWKDIANNKVERGEYEEALNQIQSLRAKLSRSWLTRLRDWFRRR